MRKFGLLILAMILTFFVSVGAVSAQEVVVKAPNGYAANYQCKFLDIENITIDDSYISGKLLAGNKDVKKTIPSNAAYFSFTGKACCGGSCTFEKINCAGKTGDAVFDFNGCLGSSARIDYNIFGSRGSVSIN